MLYEFAGMQWLKPNLYASGRHPDMNQTWLFVCSGKIKIYCWAFLDGHPIMILKLSYQDMNQKCKTAQTNQIHLLQDLTQICSQKYNQKCNQLLNFTLHTKNHVWFISGWRPDAYRLGLKPVLHASGNRWSPMQTLIFVCTGKFESLRIFDPICMHICLQICMHICKPTSYISV